MKKWIIRWAIFTLLTVVGYFAVVLYKNYRADQEWQAWVDNAKHTATENVAIWPDSILIPYQDDRRTVHVYLPPGYAGDSVAYPVLYFMDGSGCFSDSAAQAHEWRVDEVIDSMKQHGGPAAIVFGIESADNRDEEYTPFPIDDYPEAHGEAYVNWLVEEFKPWVDANYRTLPDATNTGIAGISRSGMMAYYALVSHPATFGRALIQSPSMWVDEERLIALDIEASQLADHRIYVAVGELETPMVPLAQGVHDKFAALGLKDDRLRMKVYQGMGHEHLTWRASFADGYPWLFAPEASR